MKKSRKKYPKYTLGNLLVFILAAVNILSLFLPYITGEAAVTPAKYMTLQQLLSVFGIMFVLFIIIPALVVCVLQICPWDSIKKFLLTCCFSLWLCVGTVISEVILMQSAEGGVGIGFLIGMLSSVLQIVLCILFTKISKVPQKHKDMVWYMGINKIFVLAGMPVSVAMTLGIILFFDLVFHFPIVTVLGILCIWISVVACTVVAVMSLFEKYSAGIFYYPVAFLSAVGIVSLCWSSNISMMIFGVIAASASGAFWLSLGGLARKYF